LRNPTRTCALKEKDEKNGTIAEHQELALAEIQELSGADRSDMHAFGDLYTGYRAPIFQDDKSCVAEDIFGHKIFDKDSELPALQNGEDKLDAEPAGYIEKDAEKGIWTFEVSERKAPPEIDMYRAVEDEEDAKREVEPLERLKDSTTRVTDGKKKEAAVGKVEERFAPEGIHAVDMEHILQDSQSCAETIIEGTLMLETVADLALQTDDVKVDSLKVDGWPPFAGRDDKSYEEDAEKVKDAEEGSRMSEVFERKAPLEIDMYRDVKTKVKPLERLKDSTTRVTNPKKIGSSRGGS
jgi:hypothetical protein